MCLEVTNAADRKESRFAAPFTRPHRLVQFRRLTSSQMGKQEIPFCTRHLVFEKVQGFFDDVTRCAVRERAFGGMRGNRSEMAVGTKFSGFQTIKWFGLRRHAGSGGRKAGILFLEILSPVSKDIPQKPAGFVVEVVAGHENIEAFLDGKSIEQLSFDRSAQGADASSGALADLGHGPPEDLL